MSVGQLMKQARMIKKLSAKEVAQQLEIAESTYRDWENGRKIQGEPYLDISRVLDIPLGELIGAEQREAVKQLKSDVELLDGQVKKIKNSVYSLI